MSKVSSQTIFSNLCPQDITSTEFSHFMGLDRFVDGASGHFDLYKNSGQLISLLGPTNAILKVKDAATVSTKDEASICESLEVSSTAEKEKAFSEEEQSTPVVEYGMQVLFPSPKKTRVYTGEQMRKMLFLVFESNMSPSKASSLCQMNASTASGYVNQVKSQMKIDKVFVDHQQPKKSLAITPSTVATTANSGRGKLVDIHYKFLSQLFQNNEFATLASDKIEIERKFSGLVVSTS
ncbi:hypothetical protein [Parasitella parasitica]|uniref:Uncharacterized protein n=1 Tax=Parasitella parasitica TaxID=35722 RepID=A0A0B7MU25_9FUNG|nr:hypothetical protein [Parasitella parasitica]